ncbi:hypothetical protein [Amycolatopsis echigonensis]|uniref:hypothetical protein n=1 Tax=Amycolatopsis echigonensis TaxID=2576905 RepID=UPI003A5222A2
MPSWVRSQVIFDGHAFDPYASTGVRERHPGGAVSNAWPAPSRWTYEQSGRVPGYGSAG